MELLFYWRSIYKRKWYILAFAVAFAVIASVAVSFVTPVYRATVTLMVEQNRASVVSVDEVYSGVSASREHYQTQTEILKSPALAVKVVERLNLTSHPEFDPRQRKKSFWMSLGAKPAPDGAAWTEERLQATVLRDFMGRISVEPGRFSQIIKVSFDAADRVLAASIANALAEAYIANDLDTRYRITQQASNWLSERVGVLKQNLDESETALQRYREKEGLLNTRDLAQGGATSQFESLSRAASAARQRRLEAEHSYNQIQNARDHPESLPAVIGNPQVERLKELEAGAERRLAALSSRYGPDNVRVVQARRDLDVARENTRRQTRQVIAGIRQDYETASANERATNRMLGSATGSIRDINRKEFQLEALERDVTSNRQIYERFLNRYKETTAAPTGQNSVVARVVDPAIPGWLYKPQKGRITQIAFVLGLLLGALIALLRERIDTTLRSADDVEEKLGLPTVAILPLLSGNRGKLAGRCYLDEPGSPFAEAIRTARTSILLSAIDETSKTLLITSSVPGEGKSAVSINLALAHAQTKRTLLIEADLRRPSVVQQLGLDPTSPGLAEIFAGEASFAECIQRIEGSSLYVLPVGKRPEDPLEMIGSARFKVFLERVAKACEIVIIDSPPVHLVSDAVVLSTMATGVIVVVKADSTPAPVARRVIRTLQDSGANVIGVALNQLNLKKADRYYGAYAGYSKEYAPYLSKKQIRAV